MSRLNPPTFGRVVGFLALAVFAWNAGAFSASSALQSSNPQAALGINSSNPVAIVRKAEFDFRSRAESGGDPNGIRRAAARSVKASPLNAEAFRLYGLIGTAELQAEETAPYIEMASALSRRDLGTQLFLIEDAVRKRRVSKALHHYDVALRVKDSSRPLLFPILTSALNEEYVRDRFGVYLADPPPWLESFLRNAVSSSDDPSSIADLAIAHGGFPVASAYSSLSTELMVALEAKGQFDELVEYARSIGKNVGAILQSAEFSQDSISRSLAPVAWLPYSIDGIDALFVTGDGGDLEMLVQLQPGFRGPVARKVLALPRGDFEIGTAITAEDFSPSDTLRWRISCPSAESKKFILDAAVEIEQELRKAFRFSVPEGCPVQKIEIFANTRYGSRDIMLSVHSPRTRRIGD